MGEVATDKIAPAEDKVFQFPAGLFGFPAVKRFMVAEIPGGGDLFKQLIAVEDPELAFTIVYPFPLFPQYAPDIAEEDLREVGAENAEQVMLYVIANVPQDFKQATANLRAPLMFNPFTRQGRQLILADDRFTTRERLFKG